MFRLENLPLTRLSTSTSRSKSRSKLRTRPFDVTAESCDRDWLSYSLVFPQP